VFVDSAQDSHKMHLYLARHGETDDNARLVFQGQAGRGLNRRGRAQAARLAERVKRLELSAVVTSDLERAVETAQIVAKGLGLVPALDRDLREVDVGAWTGMAYREVAERYPEEWAAWSEGFDIPRGGGETYAALAARVDAAMTRLADVHAGKRVLVVSHGGAIKSWIATLLGVSNEGLRVLAGIGNAGLTFVERDSQGRYRLHGWNDTAHLEGLAVDDHTE